MTIASFSNANQANPQLITASKTYVTKLNAAGGIKGHPVELLDCDSDRDPNKELACVQQAVDAGVVALVGSYLVSPGSLAALESAGIPNIGSMALLPGELQSPASYPATGGVVSWFYGIAAIAKDEGSRKLGGVLCETPGCVFGGQLLNDAWKLTGNPAPEFVTVPFGTPDYTPQGAILAKMDVDAITFGGGAGDFPKLGRAVLQAGFHGSIVALDAHLTPANLTALGDLAEGIHSVGTVLPTTATDNAEVKAFVKAMTDQDPSATKDATALTGWNAWNLFEAISKKIDGEPTAKSVIAALDSIKDPIQLPLSGPWKSPVSGDAPVKSAQRLAIINAIPLIVKNGSLVQMGDPLDVMKILGK